MAGPGTLYLVGTPIGNLEDMSDRARRVLGSVDVIAAEDTRRTGRLLSGLELRGRFVSFFEGNERDRAPELLRELRTGRSVAVASDAGMPGLSDPGYRLVAACAAEGIPVEVVPGPSAAVAALVVSGLPTDRFVFEGFLPRSGQARTERLAALTADSRTIVLFESPRRLARTLADLWRALGDRRAVVARELTKMHEEVRRGSLSELAERYGAEEPKGEIVVVVEGGAADQGLLDPSAAIGHARSLVAGGARKRDAAREAAKRSTVPAARIYEALVRDGQGTDAGSSSSSGERRADSSE